LHLHYIPTCRIHKLNLKWRASKENGFSINLDNGYWQSKIQKNDEGVRDEIKDVKLFTSDTANALYIQPITSLSLKGDGNGVITLMFALKRAIENYFQIESNELGATIMGEDAAPNILIYEAAEGSLGVISQIVDNPAIYKSVVEEAYKLHNLVEGENYRKHPYYTSAVENCRPVGTKLLKRFGIFKSFYDLIVSGVRLERKTRIFE